MNKILLIYECEPVGWFDSKESAIEWIETIGVLKGYFKKKFDIFEKIG